MMIKNGSNSLIQSNADETLDAAAAFSITMLASLESDKERYGLHLMMQTLVEALQDLQSQKQ